jgi:hypothetical protein
MPASSRNFAFAAEPRPVGFAPTPYAHAVVLAALLAEATGWESKLDPFTPYIARQTVERRTHRRRRTPRRTSTARLHRQRTNRPPLNGPVPAGSQRTRSDADGPGPGSHQLAAHPPRKSQFSGASDTLSTTGPGKGEGATVVRRRARSRCTVRPDTDDFRWVAGRANPPVSVLNRRTSRRGPEPPARWTCPEYGRAERAWRAIRVCLFLLPSLLYDLRVLFSCPEALLTDPEAVRQRRNAERGRRAPRTFPDLGKNFGGHLADDFAYSLAIHGPASGRRAPKGTQRQMIDLLRLGHPGSPPCARVNLPVTWTLVRIRMHVNGRNISNRRRREAEAVLRTGNVSRQQEARLWTDVGPHGDEP